MALSTKKLIRSLDMRSPMTHLLLLKVLFVKIQGRRNPNDVDIISISSRSIKRSRVYNVGVNGSVNNLKARTGTWSKTALSPCLNNKAKLESYDRPFSASKSIA